MARRTLCAVVVAVVSTGLQSLGRLLAKPQEALLTTFVDGQTVPLLGAAVVDMRRIFPHEPERAMPAAVSDAGSAGLLVPVVPLAMR